MKIRNGFVSNSSSSSFLISFEPGRKDEIEEIFKEKVIYGDATRVEAIGYKEVIEFLKDWHDIERKWSNYYGLGQFYKSVSLIAEQLNDGLDIAFIQISNHDGLSRKLASFEILESWPG